MNCPKCTARADCIDSRFRQSARYGQYRIRRYRCRCGHRFTGFEQLAPDGGDLENHNRRVARAVLANLTEETTS